MNNVEKLRKLLYVRIHESEDNYYYLTLWEQEVAAVCEDIPAAIAFIENECTDEELWWLGEVFDDIMEKTLSKEFLAALRRRAERVEDPKYKSDILEDIRTAAIYVEE